MREHGPSPLPFPLFPSYVPTAHNLKQAYLVDEGVVQPEDGVIGAGKAVHGPADVEVRAGVGPSLELRAEAVHILGLRHDQVHHLLGWQRYKEAR